MRDVYRNSGQGITERKNNMVKIDGHLTDATFKVKSHAVQVNDSGNRIFVYCVESYTAHDSYTIKYITDALATYVKETYNAKGKDEIFINIEFNVNKQIGDII